MRQTKAIQPPQPWEDMAIKFIFTKGSDAGLRTLFFTLLAITLMILDSRVAAVSQVRAILSMPLVPLQYMVSVPIQWFDDLGGSISSREALIKENRDLKANQLQLKAQVQRLRALELENNQLRALMSSSTEVQGKVLIAQLIAVSTEPFLNQVLLDKGSNDNVFIGQPVLDANGVMGKVVQVGPVTSRVLLINDAHSGVPVQVARNGIRAIAVGDAFTGQLRLMHVPQTADVRAGDMLITSGLGDHFPEGYPVGRVMSVVKDPGLQFATILIQPEAHLDRSRGVLLVWPNKVKT